MRILSGKWGGRRLHTVEGEGYRPAMGKVREALFSMLEARGISWPGLHVLDLFAGSGSLAFEASSRGAEAIWLVETSPKAVAALKRNALEFQLEPGEFHVFDCKAEVFLRRQAKEREGRQFGLIFIDPPYKQKVLSATITAIMRHNLLVPDGLLVVETEVRGDNPRPEDAHESLKPIVDRTYGQTRIIIWQNTIPAAPSTPEPSTL